VYLEARFATLAPLPSSKLVGGFPVSPSLHVPPFVAGVDLGSVWLGLGGGITWFSSAFPSGTAYPNAHVLAGWLEPTAGWRFHRFAGGKATLFAELGLGAWLPVAAGFDGHLAGGVRFTLAPWVEAGLEAGGELAASRLLDLAGGPNATWNVTLNFYGAVSLSVVIPMGGRP